jgi:hypothetical protein
MAAADTHIASGRADVYRALKRRNRVVLLLRILVPLVGLAVFAVLGVQLVISQMTKDFTIGHLSVERDHLVVEAPSYAGAMSDGSVYKIFASKAEASLAAANLIDLNQAEVTLTRPDGLSGTAKAAAARIDTNAQTLTVEGVTSLADSTGGGGTVTGLEIDYPGQKMRTTGAVDATLSTGESLQAASMEYDAAKKLWRFERVTITLPGTPGDSKP